MATDHSSGARRGVAEICETLAAAGPDATAVVQGGRRVRWSEFMGRSGGVAAALLRGGLQRQDRVALYLYNCPEYLEAFVAAARAALVPVNTNYRYLDDELVHLWDDADAAAVVFHGSFAERIDRVRHRLPLVRLWLWVDDGAGACPPWATSYEDATREPAMPPPSPPSADDRIFVYTGGTTGLPKGVMWTQHQLLAPVLRTGFLPDGGVLPAPPLMHGTGMMAALAGLLRGLPVVLLAGRGFDAAELWETVQRERVAMLSVVGDAFARPMLDSLDREPGRWNLESVQVLLSAGAMFSEPVKRGLLRHLPGMLVVDQLGSSENGNGAVQVSHSGHAVATGAFRLAEGSRVIDDDGRDVEPGSGRIGRLAIPGGALGYHKDPEKSARTFPMIDGRRYTVAGDFATVDADGTLRLLGRGSVCINTGGEKVFPEEVEEALKTHPAVRDAVVVGVPDERFGEAITAVVELRGPAADDELVDHVKSRIARYKAPRHLVRVDSVGRAPNGKADYPGTRTLAIEALATGHESAVAAKPDADTDRTASRAERRR